MIFKSFQKKQVIDHTIKTTPFPPTRVVSPTSSTQFFETPPILHFTPPLPASTIWNDGPRYFSGLPQIQRQIRRHDRQPTLLRTPRKRQNGRFKNHVDRQTIAFDIPHPENRSAAILLQRHKSIVLRKLHGVNPQVLHARSTRQPAQRHAQSSHGRRGNGGCGDPRFRFEKIVSFGGVLW